MFTSKVKYIIKYSKPKILEEADVLELFVDYMESEGVDKNLVHLNIDANFADELAKKHKIVFTKEELYPLVDRCLANEWLKHKALGGKYNCLGLTTSGFGVVRSRQAKKNKLAERSYLKKTSDYIEEHKGIFILAGASIALATLVIRILGDS